MQNKMLKFKNSLNKRSGASMADLHSDAEFANQREIDQQEARFEEIRRSLKLMQKRLGSLNKSNHGNVEEGRQFGDVLQDTGKVLKLMTYDENSTALGECLLNVGKFQRAWEDLRSGMDPALNSGLVTPVNDFLACLEEAKTMKKEFDRMRNVYMTSCAKTKREKESKKTNPAKVKEAENEEKENKESLARMGESTVKAFNQMMVDNQQRLLDGLCSTYLPSLERFLASGVEEVQHLQDKLAELKKKGEEKQAHFQTEKKKKQKQAKKRGKKALLKRKSSIKDIAAERLTVLDELIDSENLYLKRLDPVIQIKQNVEKLWKEDPKLQEKFTREDRLAMFSEIEHIYKWHKEFVEQLEQCKKDHPKENVGAVFVNNISKWKLYYDYVSNISHALNALNKSKDVKQVKGLLCEDIQNLLELPTNRVQKYVSILKDLNVFTPENTQQQEDMSKALCKMKKIVHGIEASLEASRQTGQLINISNQLTGFRYPIVEPHRRLLIEGTITMIHPSAPAQREDYKGFLFNDYLLFAKPIQKPKIAGLIDLGKDSNSTSFKFVGRFYLRGASIEDLPDKEDLYNAFRFTAIRHAGDEVNDMAENGTDSGGGSPVLKSHMPNTALGEEYEETHTLILPTFSDKRDWLSALTNAVTLLETSRVFALPITTLMEQNPKEQGREIPRVVDICCKTLLKRGLRTEGLFRESGSAKVIEYMKNNLDLGGELDFTWNENNHNISGLLKLWIRDLPEPLFTYDHYDEWVLMGNLILREKASGAPTLPQSLPELKRQVMEALPRRNAFILQELMKLLHEVAKPENNAVNKMMASNIAIVFGPILCTRRNANPFEVADLQPIYNVITTMVLDYSEVFGEIEALRSKPEEQEETNESDKDSEEESDSESDKGKGKETTTPPTSSEKATNSEDSP